jgi:hypothetical protein
MSVLGPAEAETAVRAVMKRAATDAQFHALALRDPAAAIEEATGSALPEGFTVRFVDNQGADRTFVLPELATSTEELSDAQLEHVAGGRCGQSCGGSCAYSDASDVLKKLTGG